MANSRQDTPAVQSRVVAANQNVELKARVKDLPGARLVAERIATGRLDPEHQVDTYFACRHGRLKLREINAQLAQLIWYTRPDDQYAKLSNYHILDVPDPTALKHVLASAIGVHAIVNKQREIFLYENVRIHLDRVQDLGNFLEFEAVLSGDDAEEAGRSKVEFLSQQFAIAPSDVLANSYADMN